MSSRNQSNLECPRCGFPVKAGRHDCCPKCEAPIRSESLFGMLEVDVAHGGETWDAARGKIESAVDKAIYYGHAGVKIIHGHGSSTGQSVIGPKAIKLMKELATSTGGTFAQDRNNPGAHIIWFN